MSELTKISQSLIIKKIDAKTLNIQVLNNEILMSIAGQFDQNLKELEKLTNTNVYFHLKWTLFWFHLNHLSEKNRFLLFVFEFDAKKGLGGQVP